MNITTAEYIVYKLTKCDIHIWIIEHILRRMRYTPLKKKALNADTLSKLVDEHNVKKSKITFEECMQYILDRCKNCAKHGDSEFIFEPPPRNTSHMIKPKAYAWCKNHNAKVEVYMRKHGIRTEFRFSTMDCIFGW